MSMVETRKLNVSPTIIFSLIKAQAGTLGKAITECVMNSVDAMATEVHIELTNTSVRIIDDGSGFQSRDEIEAWFETLGFDHNDEGNHRTFGAFGIGRAQLWSFASTVWRTHQFVMDVDIKRKGLDYELNEFGRPVPGLTIEGALYAPLNDGQQAAIEQELRTLIRFVEIPVYLNGRNLCVDPSKQQWDFETPDAWFKFDQTKSAQLTVYNMGVYVKSYWFGQHNIGGLVVTKPKVKLALNMARNDVLVAECSNWPRITAVLKSNSKVEASKPKTEKLSEEALTAQAQSLLVATTAHNVDVFLDVRGRNRDFWSVFRHSSLICFAEKSDEKAKRAHSLKLACVLQRVTLARFGVKTASELRDVLMKAPTFKHSYYKNLFDGLTLVDTLEEALPNLDDQYETLPEKDLTDLERLLLKALGKSATYLSWMVAKTSQRRHLTTSVRAGKSDKALSWAMAGDILLDRRLLKSGSESYQGFCALGARVLHELIDEIQDSNKDHTHDASFYERFHAMMTNEAVYDQLRRGFDSLVRECAKKGVDLPTKALADASSLT